MDPDVESSPVNGSIRAGVVFDMVYKPAMTALLRAAAAQEKTIIPGERMLRAQAARQFEIWTGRPAPREVYES